MDDDESHAVPQVLVKRLLRSMGHEHFKNAIPDEASKLSAALYGSFYCVKEHFELFREFENVNTFVIYDGENPVHVLFYAVAGKEVVVLNEFFPVEDEYVNYFAEFIFARYGRVGTIHFSHLFSRPVRIERPHITWSLSHDILLDLPGSTDEYQALLGKKTRKTIRYYGNKLKKDFGEFSFAIQEKEEIDPAVIGRICELNRLRMKTLKITSAVDREFERRTTALARHYGVVGYIEVGGELAAGVVCYEVGDHSFGEILGYDQSYMDYRIALICAYSTVAAMIERGSRIFHMAPGESDYKYRLGGQRRPVYTFSLFRNGRTKAAGIILNLDKHHIVRRSRNAIKYKIVEKVKNSLPNPF